MNIFKLALGFLLAEQALSFSAPPSLINTRTTTQLQAVTLDGKEIRGPITPLGNFVLVKTKETLSATDGGILLPDQVCMYCVVLCCAVLCCVVLCCCT